MVKKKVINLGEEKKVKNAHTQHVNQLLQGVKTKVKVKHGAKKPQVNNNKELIKTI